MVQYYGMDPPARIHEQILDCAIGNVLAFFFAYLLNIFNEHVCIRFLIRNITGAPRWLSWLSVQLSLRS